MSEAKSFILCTSSFFSVWSNLNVRLVHCITVEKDKQTKHTKSTAALNMEGQQMAAWLICSLFETVHIRSCLLNPTLEAWSGSQHQKMIRFQPGSLLRGRRRLIPKTINRYLCDRYIIGRHLFDRYLNGRQFFLSNIIN